MSKKRILWVDDEISLLKPFIIFLEKKGYEIDTNSNGYDAVKQIVKKKYDLILMDEMMPGMDGLTTIEEIKKINSFIPIVMVTKSEEEGIMDEAIAKHISDYLIKPIKPNQILLTVKRILEAEKIRNSKIGEEYAKFSANVNRQIMNQPNWEEWQDIYKNLVDWDIRIDELNDDDLSHMHFLMKKNCNTEYSNYVARNYQNWLKSDSRPELSYDIVSEYVIPSIQEGKGPVYFIVLDCLRFDQYRVIEPFLRELFDIDLSMYFSILPTATEYSRNSIFSGLLPSDFFSIFPEYWTSIDDIENSRNRNEHQLVDYLLKDLGCNLSNGTKYTKIYNIEEAVFVNRSINSWKNEDLVILVYNFLDLVAHHRSQNQILQEAIPDESALRAFTKHWFLHSSFYNSLKQISKQKNATVIITTDHGSIKVNRASKIIGDKDISNTIRYKHGRNISINDKHALKVKNINDFGLLSDSIVDNYVFAKEDYYFVYPNSYNKYKEQIENTFQHGGISLEEMVLPVAVCKSKG